MSASDTLSDTRIKSPPGGVDAVPVRALPMQRGLADAADLVAAIGTVPDEVALQSPAPAVDAGAVLALVVALHEEGLPIAARLAVALVVDAPFRASADPGIVEVPSLQSRYLERVRVPPLHPCPFRRENAPLALVVCREIGRTRERASRLKLKQERVPGRRVRFGYDGRRG